MPAPPSPRCSRLPPPPLPPRHHARSLLPAMPAQAPRCRPRLLHRVQPTRQSSAPRSQSGRRRHHGSLRNPRPHARSPELRWAPALAPDTMLCPTLNLATTPSTTPPSFLATTPSLDGRRDWWHLPDLGARLILAPNAAPTPISAASSDGSQDNAPSPSPEPQRLTFQGCRSAILTSPSLAVARPPDRRLRPRDPPDSPTSPSTAASITHLLHADEKARPPLSPRPPTTRLLNKDLSKHPVDGFSAGLVDDSNVFEWQVTIIGPPDTLYPCHLPVNSQNAITICNDASIFTLSCIGLLFPSMDLFCQVTEENLAALFINCGQGARAALNLSGTVLRYYPVRVLPSKTAIAPVNPTFLPRSDDEQEMCARTIYCTNIDKKVTQADLKLFFESICGEKMTIQPAQYHWLTAMTATGEFAAFLTGANLIMEYIFSNAVVARSFTTYLGTVVGVDAPNKCRIPVPGLPQVFNQVDLVAVGVILLLFVSICYRYLSAGTLGLNGAFSKVAKLELVMLVHPADCKSMLDAFIAGCDFHSRTTMSMYQHIRETDEEEKDAFGAERRKL
ncbi:Polyadenylate-binding protein-interacting protein 10 [Zea mays]|uniref:Polyadenylate-binding protein-interacting protein 10 n=1 Tax=Zea mays TaxID=4577 RepID=A0A3L6FMR7_MAIZE|nr:Polyadenylate-binding protein-interacting protein 10 [Zea mays]